MNKKSADSLALCTFYALTNEETEAMLRERAEPQTVGAAFRKLLRSFLRG